MNKYIITYAKLSSSWTILPCYYLCSYGFWSCLLYFHFTEQQPNKRILNTICRKLLFSWQWVEQEKNLGMENSKTHPNPYHTDLLLMECYVNGILIVSRERSLQSKAKQLRWLQENKKKSWFDSLKLYSVFFTRNNLFWGQLTVSQLKHHKQVVTQVMFWSWFRCNVGDLGLYLQTWTSMVPWDMLAHY